ncbi:SAM-dependent methyltransferase [Acidobacteriota bacterium]
MKIQKMSERLPSSFRDPSGFIFKSNGSIYRQINRSYQSHYDLLMESGLYKYLIDKEFLIPHEEKAEVQSESPANLYKVIEPEFIPFISYPYEWCFSQLKDAALLTLEIQKQALKYGMSLKDCSAYNIQFRRGKPVFIDTLSFEKYQEGKPWVAYRQFCQHFLAPLALMSERDIRLGQLLRIYLDGLPLDLANSLLPLRSRFKFSLFSHISLHAKSQRYFAEKTVQVREHNMKHNSFLGILDSLETAVKKLNWKPEGTQWVDYYEDTNYSQAAGQHKQNLVAEFLDKIGPTEVWDLGGNVGTFSRLASDRGILTISFDIDFGAVELNYLESKKRGETHLMPLRIDLTNPSPGLGWENIERDSLAERGPVDAVLALALIHHLAISNNLPLNQIADFFQKLCSSLIIEFIPKTDSQIKRLLVSREDIFPEYTQEMFEKEFGQFFSIERTEPIKDSERTLYLMRKRIF